MKKILAMVLAMMLVLSMSAAFAAEYTVNQPATLTKNYDVISGTTPAETFTFKFAFESFVDADKKSGTLTEEEKADIAIDDVTIDFAAISADAYKTASLAIDPAKYPAVGVYTYNVTEVDGASAGVVYNTQNLKLVVTILHNAENENEYVAVIYYTKTTTNEDGEQVTEKISEVTNSYSAGNLAVTKKITGNMADMKKEFNFTITFTAPAGDIIRDDSISVDNDGATRDVKEGNVVTYTVALGQNETINFTNVPAGVTYNVTEDAENYTHTAADEVFSDGTKTISNGDNDTVVFTNKLDNAVDTGISLDNAPYMILMALVVIAGAALIVKRASANR